MTNLLLNAVDAAERGACILTRSRVVAAEHDGEAWNVQIHQADHSSQSIRARALVDATGPWVTALKIRPETKLPARSVRLVRIP